MSKVRVYEVARELSLENNELMKRLATLGIQVRNHMSALDVAEIDRVKRAIEKDKVENTVETKLRAGVVRRRTVAQPKDEVVAEVRAPEPVAPPPPRVEPPPARVEPVVREPEPPPPVVARVEPARVEPARVEPARVEPARVEPAPVEPARVEPAPVEPARVEPVVAAPPPREPTPPPPPPREPMREVEVTQAPLPPARRSQPAPASERFAHANLPPGVLSRGNLSAPSAAPQSKPSSPASTTAALW
jgi:translation initiation factor IF-2